MSDSGPDRRWVRILASGFGTGYAPVASGTFGTLVAIPLAWALGFLPAWAWTLVVVAFIYGACLISTEAEKIFGQKDSGIIVIDEVAGYLVTMAYLEPTAFHLVLGFFLFRLFDIVKPWPARQLERTLPGGYGVVLDDVAAGVWAAVSLRGVNWLLA